MKQFTSIFLVALLLYSCKSETLPNGLLVIDLKDAIDNKQTIDIAELKADIEYTLLDNTEPNSLVGDIQELKISDTGYYLYDRSNRLTKFNKQGRFLGVFLQQGKGPGEYVSVTSMSIMPDDSQAFVLTDNKLISIDNSTGTVYEKNINLDIAQVFICDDKAYGVANIQYLTERANKMIYAIDKNSLECTPIAGNNYALQIDIPLSFSMAYGDSQKLYYKEEQCDTVFSITGNDRVTPEMVLDMGIFKFPADCYDFSSMDLWSKYYRPVFLANSDNYALIHIQNGLMGDVLPVLCNKLTGKTQVATDFHIGKVKTTPYTLYDNKLICYINPMDLLDMNDSELTTEQIDVKRQLSEESNPVIVVVNLD